MDLEEELEDEDEEMEVEDEMKVEDKVVQNGMEEEGVEPEIYGPLPVALATTQ